MSAVTGVGQRCGSAWCSDADRRRKPLIRLTREGWRGGADLQAHLFGAVRPATGEGFALVLPDVSTAATQAFLDHLAATIREDVHVALVLDGAGWHGARDLVVPPSISLIPLAPYAPESNPVERVWLHLRERLLSHRLLDGHDAILEACCEAWNVLTPERLRTLTAFP